MFESGITFVQVLVAVLSILELQCHAVALSENFKYGTSKRPFTCDAGGQFWCDGIYTANKTSGDLGMMRPIPADWTDSVPATYSMVTMTVPILLFDTARSQWNSFRTSIRFLITSLGGGESRGEGFTFVILGTPDQPGLGGYALGVYNGTSRRSETLAIEFDVRKSDDISTLEKIGDINSNHVGVDVDRIQSKVQRSAGEIGISLLGKQIYAWIDYESLSKLLEIRISYSKIKPDLSFLNYTVDLSKIFVSGPQVYVGFSAGNGGEYSYYDIIEWYFEHSPSTTVDAPGPAPNATPSGSGGTDVMAVIASVSGGAVALLLFGLLTLFLCKRKSYTAMKQTQNLGDMGVSVEYSYKQLSKATGQFQEESKLGQGGFGSVYKGVLPDTGQSVAVKRVSSESKQGFKEFMAEVSIISQLRHRNVVKLLGWCLDRDKFLLVYELMPNGSLDRALFHPAAGSVLSWELRFKIILGAAEALAYLHKGWRQQVIHRDFKSSNILLDEEFNAMLGDFGLARKVDHHQDLATTKVAGTYGYIAPEVPATQKFTEKTDVYAFGAVTLEIVTGCRALNCDPVDPGLLVESVWSKVVERNINSCIDERLEKAYDEGQPELLLHLGLLCCDPVPDARPSMQDALHMLRGAVPMPPLPSSRPSSLYHHSGPNRVKHWKSTSTATPLESLGSLDSTSLSMQS
ncbi:hypothetical protein Mapa_008215 [Marchantia paleacea]|nr:hypothetical protein Mapa_008215 [Marchantia paleacea]